MPMPGCRTGIPDSTLRSHLFGKLRVPCRAGGERPVGGHCAAQKLNATQTREIPEDAPVSFVRRRWVAFVKSEGGLNRCYYELCVLSEIRNALRSGDLWVVGSRQFKDFDGYLLPQPLYEEIRTKGLPLPVEPDGKRYLPNALRDSKQNSSRSTVWRNEENAGRRYQGRPSQNNALGQGRADDADEANRRIYARMPHIRITELLLEVDRWTGFSRHFTHQKSGDPPADTALLLTAILADGLNLGLTKMAEACPDHNLCQAFMAGGLAPAGRSLLAGAGGTRQCPASASPVRRMGKGDHRVIRWATLPGRWTGRTCRQRQSQIWHRSVGDDLHPSL